MKRILFLGLITLLANAAMAQLVVTVAGQLEVAGHADGQAFDALFDNPHGIAVDQNGVVYIADRWGNYIRRLSPAGQVSTIAGNGNEGNQDGPGLSATFNEPWGLAVDNFGNVFVADTRNNLIRKIDAAGNVSTYAGTGNFGTSDGPALNATFGNPTGIEVDEEGNVYVADHLTHIIRKISPDMQVTTIAGTPYTPGAADGTGIGARFYRPYGLTLDRDGNIIVADEWNHKIRRVTPGGTVTTIAGSGVIGAEDGAGINAFFNFPWDVAVDTLGNIFVADGYNNTIRKILPSGGVLTYVGTAGVTGGLDGTGPDASFAGATALAYFDATDEIFVGDAYNELIRKVINLNQTSIGLQIVSEDGGIFCEGTELQIKAIPEVYNSYAFYVDDELVTQSSNPIFSTTSLDGGVHRIRVEVAEGANIYSSSDILVTVKPAPEPTINIIGDSIIYQSDSVTLVSSYGERYAWSTGDSTAAITVHEEGAYSVSIQNQQGCWGASAAQQVRVIPTPIPPAIIFLTGSTEICPNTEAVLQSSYLENNQWYKDGWPIPGATESMLSVTESGIYRVQVTDSLGVTLQSPDEVIEVIPPFLDSLSATLLQLSDSIPSTQFKAHAQNAIRYDWDFGDPESGSDNSSDLANPMHTYSGPGQYTVTLIVESMEGCVDTLTMVDYIEYRTTNNSGGNGNNGNNGSGSGSGGNNGNTGNPTSSGDVLYIPNAFTPNGDQKNDVFLIRGSGLAQVELYIYNKWGELLFESRSQQDGWDGTYKGEIVQPGTYTYMAILQLDTGFREVKSGHISVVR